MADEIYRPTGDGSALVWLSKSGGDHWVEVDEVISDNDGSYVYKVTYPPNGIPVDLYTKADPGSEIEDGDDINYIRVYLNCRTLSGRSNAAGVLYKVGWTTAYIGTSTQFFTLYATAYSQWNTNPETGLPWTKADLNSLEFGIAKTGASETHRCTQVWLVVNHNPPAAVKKHLLNGCLAPLS